MISETGRPEVMTPDCAFCGNVIGEDYVNVGGAMMHAPCYDRFGVEMDGSESTGKQEVRGMKKTIHVQNGQNLVALLRAFPDAEVHTMVANTVGHDSWRVVIDLASESEDLDESELESGWSADLDF